MVGADTIIWKGCFGGIPSINNIYANNSEISKGYYEHYALKLRFYLNHQQDVIKDCVFLGQILSKIIRIFF